MIKLIKKIIEKKKSEKEESKLPNIDNDLPFNIKINSIIRFDPSLLLSDEFKIAIPQEDLIVKAFATYDLANCPVYRFYLSDTNQEVYKLDIVKIADPLNEDEYECKLYKNFDEIYPKDEEDWAFWLEEVIGSEIFTYTGNEPEDDEEEYMRIWGGDDEFVEPFENIVTVYYDNKGKEKVIFDETIMLYGKELLTMADENILEYFLLSHIEHEEETLISIDVGVDIEANLFQVYALQRKNG